MTGLVNKGNTIAIPAGFNPRDPASVAAALAALPTNGRDVYSIGQSGGAGIIGPALEIERLEVSTGPSLVVEETLYALTLPAETFSLATGGVVEVVDFVAVTPPAAVVAVASLAPGVSTGASVAVPVAAVMVEAVMPAVAGGASVAVQAAGIAVAGLVPDLVGRQRTQVLVPVAGVVVSGLVPVVVFGASVAVPAAGVTVSGLVPANIGGPPTDPDFASVSLLLHMEGSDGSTTFTDSSSNGRSVFSNGGAQISTVRSKYGTGSCLLNGNFLTTTVPGGLGAGDFTIEMWFYATTTSLFLFNTRTNGTSGDGIDMLENGRISTANAFIVSSSMTFVQNTWNHFAITRESGTITRWLNGISTGTGINNSNFSGSNFYIGGNNLPSLNQGYLNGNLDEVRITVGIARYTANFTPPTEPFPDA
jgi:hypothetical protein